VPALIVAAPALRPAHLARCAPDEVGQAQRSAAGNDWRGTLMLLAIVGLRSLAHMGLFTFIPLYELSRGNSAAYGTQMLAVFLFAGALGTLIGGPLADRVGRRRVLLGSFIVSPPLILVYVLVGGPAGTVALFFAGMAVIGTFGVTLVMSQEYMPGRVGVASGLSIASPSGSAASRRSPGGTVADAATRGRRARDDARAGTLHLPHALPPPRTPRPLESAAATSY
jgi:FSR family fosmidomycin resistance protein-like MFS transporter